MQSNPNLGNIIANSKLLPTAEMDALKRTRLDFFGIWKKLLLVWSHGVHLHIKTILYHYFSSEGEIRYNTVTHSHLGHIFQSHFQFGRCGGRVTEKKEEGLSYCWRRTSLKITLSHSRLRIAGMKFC